MTLGNRQHGADAAERQTLIGHAAEGLLAAMPPHLADAVRLGAVPHWFDRKLLGRLCGDELDADQVLPYLERFSFVRQDAQGRFRYHRGVRDYLLAWWREERPRQYEKANRSALVYFRALVQDAISVERPIYEREVLYHLLVVDEAAGLQFLSVRFEDARGRYQLGEAEGFVTQAAQLEENLTDEGRAWTRYLEARLDLAYRRGDAGQTTFKDLADHAPHPVLQAVSQWNLGQIQVNQGEWSKAIRLYRASLALLQGVGTPAYQARVMLALGDAYRDLAESSGGFCLENGQAFDGVHRFLHTLQHLPFLAYEGLVRRVSFLPNWFFGTNYQDWIIAYLLIEATRWYRRAEKQLGQKGDIQGLAEARLSLGQLEHQLGRWSRARRRYALLLEIDEIKGSLYRTAQVRLGQGRAFLDEGALGEAETALSEAAETFRRFEDKDSLGAAAALLGRAYATLARPGEAASAYLESIQAFGDAGDDLARTQVVWALEDLAQHSTLHEEQRQEIDAAVVQVDERHYLVRFPDSLLRWFRRLALWGALPLTYALTFIIGLALTLSLWIVEGVLTLSLTGAPVPTAIADILLLSAFASLPVLFALWLYRLLYTLMGIALVRFLGRRLIPIEKEQPSRLVTDARGLTHHDVSKDETDTLTWSDVSVLASVDYYQRRRAIHLISGTVLVAKSGMTTMVEAITTGYEHLQQDIARRLGRHRDRIKQQSLDFVFLRGRRTLALIALSLIFALYLAHSGTVELNAIDETSGQEIPLLLSSITVSFIPTLLLIYPAAVLWRLVGHRIGVQRTLRYPTKAIPTWLLWLAAVLSTAIAVLWMALLTTMS